jgi:hypothetical protein
VPSFLDLVKKKLFDDHPDLKKKKKIEELIKDGWKRDGELRNLSFEKM